MVGNEFSWNLRFPKEKEKEKEKLFGRTFEAGHEHKATPAPAFWHMLACYYFFIFFLSLSGTHLRIN